MVKLFTIWGQAGVARAIDLKLRTALLESLSVKSKKCGSLRSSGGDSLQARFCRCCVIDFGWVWGRSQGPRNSLVPRRLTKLAGAHSARACKAVIAIGEWWCCEGGSNSRPHPYQGCALPLSYHSMTVARCLGPNFNMCKRNLDPFLRVM